MNKLVIFGAGKIGRSFIGQLFSLSGYEVVFIDINKLIINELNRLKEYKIVIKSSMSDVTISVNNVRGVLGTNVAKVVEEISDCDIAAVSVGQNALPKVIPVLAEGLMLRYKKHGKKPLDIILAENMHDAEKFVNNILHNILGNSYPLNELIGLIETSIGKMVPIMPVEVQERDPLVVYAEPFNTLIVDKKAFKNTIPDINGLAPKENIKAWVDRKSHIHNFGHAAAAYAGFIADPSVQYLADVLNITSVKEFTRNAMIQSASLLMRKYPGEFTFSELENHIDDLLLRFENRSLGDTVFRVGCDLKRKLNRNDRILTPLIDGINSGSPVDLIIQAFNYGLRFRACDEKGQMFPGDEEFHQELRDNGLLYILKNICGLNHSGDHELIQRILLDKTV